MTDHRTANITELTRKLGPLIAGPEGLCLNVNPSGDPTRWLQFVDGQLNAATFETNQPDALLAQLGGAEFIDFEPGKYLTVNLASRDPETVATWIHDYLRQGLQAPEDLVLDTTTEQL